MNRSHLNNLGYIQDNRLLKNYFLGLGITKNIRSFILAIPKNIIYLGLGYDQDKNTVLEVLHLGYFQDIYKYLPYQSFRNAKEYDGKSYSFSFYIICKGVPVFVAGIKTNHLTDINITLLCVFCQHFFLYFSIFYIY